MIGRLVITSVEQGLGVGPGFQPVLRTHGMQPAVANRLRLCSGYPHPYPFGDRRNPEVYFHRIESVSGRRLHVVARLADAGSDYSGRSNRISDLLVLDDAECRRWSHGPAAVAKAFSWCRSWSESPREVAPLTSLHDPHVPAAEHGPCRAWAIATGDAGWAGELAKSFTDGRSATIVAHPGDDVLALFVEALGLLPPEQRWNVTFTTCELERSAAVWRAVRSDIARPTGKNDAKTLFLDLAALARARARAPDHAFAQAARGEVGAGSRPQASAPTQISVEPPSSPPGRPPDRPGPPPSVGHEDVGAGIRRRRRRAAAVQSVHGSPTARVSSLWTWIVLGASVLAVIPVIAFVVWLANDPQAIPKLNGIVRPQAMRVDRDIANDLDSRAVRPVRQPQAESAKPPGAETTVKESPSAGPTRKPTDVEQEKKSELSGTPDKVVEAKTEELPKETAITPGQREAFRAFRGLPEIVSLTKSNKKASLDDLEGSLPKHEIGDYDVDKLIDPAMELAAPRFLIKKAPVSLSLKSVSSGTWAIVASNLDHMGPSEKPRQTQGIDVAKLFVKDRRLCLEHTTSEQYVRQLQNCVLVVSCRDPDSQKPVEHLIRFAEPETCQAVECDVLRVLKGGGGKQNQGHSGENHLSYGKRLQEVDPACVKYTVRVTHPWLPGGVITRTCSGTQQVVELKSEICLGVRHGRGPKLFAETLLLTVGGTLALDPVRGAVAWSPFRHSDDEAIQNVFEIERMRKYREKEGDLEDAYKKVIQEKEKDPTGKIYDSLFHEYQRENPCPDKKSFQSPAELRRELAQAINDRNVMERALAQGGGAQPGLNRNDEERSRTRTQVGELTEDVNRWRKFLEGWETYLQRYRDDYRNRLLQRLTFLRGMPGSGFCDPIRVEVMEALVQAQRGQSKEKYDVHIVKAVDGEK